MAKQLFILTRQRMGLDRKVWLVLLFTCLVSIGLAAYKVTRKEPCNNLVMVINSGTATQVSKTFFVGETVRFAALFAEGKDIRWDFGDKSRGETGIRATHSFKTEGNYDITLKAGECEFHEIVKIKNYIRDSSTNSKVMQQLLENPIDGNTNPTVMQSVLYSSNLDASAYEWSVVNYNSYPVIKTKEAQYTFSTPGLKTLQLMLDNDPGKVYTRDIFVQKLPNVVQGKTTVEPPPFIPVFPAPAPDPGKTEEPAEKTSPSEPVPTGPTAPKSVRIGNENFKDMLQDVVRNELDINDFNAYLCNKGATIVIVDGERKWTNFTELCKRIKGKSKYEVKSVEQVIDNGCVVKLKVDLKKKLL